ncbi:histidine phosphatase superfamily [Leucosporidium creatinivorum]|uniref:Histidine phosphatase superfamily n=1 Tax=Leucosporidium creatinivorum TaxID=106004 RepID=A0A1Y2EL21_9BASI|nr:histidine phosphatase superfamily [Leucosporidium creatinivorum]
MTRRAIITIVRHGETDHNRAKIIQGHLDTPLNPEGEAQAVVVARFLGQTVKFEETWSSDLQRARKTAEAIASQQTDGVELQIDERIRERFLGELQGKHRASAPPSAHQTIEPGPVLSRRLMSFWDEKLASLPSLSSPSDPPTQILLVSHGGAIRHLIEDLVVARKQDYAIDLQTTDEETLREGIMRRIGNCCVTEVHVEEVEGKWVGRLTKYADEEHFVESSRAPSRTGNEDVID